MRYYISDLHFGHERLNIGMDKRGFASADEMDEYMINQWNSKVKKKDEVVILGDFAIYTKAEKVNEILSRLNGKKYLVRGNHDRYTDKRDFDKSAFEWIRDYAVFHDNGRKIIVSHYPIMCYDGQYKRNKNGEPTTYMLYGHVHNTYDENLVDEFIKITRSRNRMLYVGDGKEEMTDIPCQMINCFCMFSDYKPLSLEEWIEVDAKRRENERN